MNVEISMNIVKGDISEVTPNGTVILHNVILLADTGTQARPRDTSFRSDRGSLLSPAQVVIPSLTMTREQTYSLPSYMQVEIRRKAEKI